MGQLEIDFIALKGEERKYIQVCQTLSNDETKKRELRPFRKIVGKGSRLLITADPIPITRTEEATIQNIIDFLEESNRKSMSED